MTTDFINISRSNSDTRLRQLPVIANGSVQNKTVNIDRMSAEKRQNIADLATDIDKAENITASPLSVTNLEDSIQDLNHSIQLISRNLEFYFDSASGRTVITVRDTESNEVIRQIPSDQLLEIAAKLKLLQENNSQENAATGILFTSQT